MKNNRVFAFGFTAVALFLFAAACAVSQEAQHPEDIAEVQFCPLCGMDRAKFAHSRVYVRYENGTTYGSCSLHCAAIDLATEIGLTPVAVSVGDFGTGDLIDAEEAAWVLGGDMRGVMTRRAKWAFGSPDAARAFIAQNGGEMVDFETALKAAYEDMYDDVRMIRQKRREMRMKPVE